MKFEAAIPYASAPHVVEQMLADARFYRLRAGVLDQLRDVEVTLGNPGRGLHVVTSATVKAADVDARLAQLLPTDMTLTWVESWEGTPGPGGRGTAALDVAGVPMSVTASCHLECDGERVTRRIDGEVRAQIPLFGRTIERAVLTHLDALVRLERRAEREWVTGADA